MRHLSHVTSAHLSCVLPHRPAHTLWNPAGVLKQDGERDTGTVFLHPCDTRLPRMMVPTTTLPPALREVSRGRRCVGGLGVEERNRRIDLNQLMSSTGAVAL